MEAICDKLENASGKVNSYLFSIWYPVVFRLWLHACWPGAVISG
jgi:hypothetical protein